MATIANPNRRRRRDAQHASSPQTDRTGSIPSDLIEQRAYERFVQRGRADGADVEDWLDAERELLSSRTTED